MELERELKKRLTIDNPHYIAAKKYGRWVGKKIKPQLKYYEQLPGGIVFPRGFSNQAVLLCRHILQEEPTIQDGRRQLPQIDFSFKGLLRPYQQEAVERAKKRSFGVLEAGTGSGKTVMALALIAKRAQPALVIVHTKELLYQWRQRIEEFLGCPVGMIGDGLFQIEDITVAIVNTARKRVAELVPLFGHLVVDECHRVPATLFTDVVSSFDSYYLLGLSATAFRSDDGMTRLIYFYMGDRIHRVDQEELAATGAIVTPQLVTQTTVFSYRYRGDYHALITALTTHAARNRQIVDDICRVVGEGQDGTVLVVSDRVSHCEVFVELLGRRKIVVALLTGQTSQEIRNQVVADVQEGRCQVLVATLQLISEGFDCAGLHTLFLTTPISFEGRLFQVIGRIMRPGKNKRARVFDYNDEQVSVLKKSAIRRRDILEADTHA